MWVVGKSLLAGLALLTLLASAVGAREIVNTSDQCSDVLMLFARGSSSNPNGLNTDFPFSEEFQNGMDDPENPGKKIGAEEIPGSFFRWMEKRIKADYPHVDYKAVSVHYSGKGYSQNGYPAVGIFGPTTIGNALQAKFTWWEAGEYNDSVDSGSQELAGYVRDSTINCPAQRIVVGGYSQGAHVVHEALNIIPDNERSVIDNVVLFGDPKFVASDFDKFNPFDKPRAYPWHRGTAGLRETGLSGTFDPYVPADMTYKTISWCHEDDFVCTGFSGLSWAITNHEMPGNEHSIWKGVSGAIGDGHTRYPVFGVPESTGEVMENLRTHLTALEKDRGGIDPKLNPYQKVYDTSLVNDRPIDLMLALNYTGGNEDSQAQYMNNLKNITKQYKKNFTQMNTGGLMYTDLAGNAYTANSSYVAGYARQANQLSSNMDNAFNGNVYFGGGPGGGGDYPENHGMLIERGGMFANWRDNATKHLVIFAERPAQESWSFNMCTSSTIGAFQYGAETPCVSGNQFSTTSRPQWCSTIVEVISLSTCPFNGPTTYTKVVSRSLSDAVLLARAKGFVVDIVQPHGARDTMPAPHTPTYVENQLKTLAESTGGLYLKYGAFDEPAMRDAIWQILNHQPKIMSVSQHRSGDLLDFSDTKLLPLPILGKAEFLEGKSSLVSVTPVSGARSYGWDFDSNGLIDEYSDGPSTEKNFDQPGMMTVKAYSGPSGTGEISAKVLTFGVTPDESPQYIPEALSGLDGLSANRLDGTQTTNISWDVPADHTEFGLVVIKDDSSGIVLATIPVSEGAIDIDSSASVLSVQYVDDGAEAEEQSVQVTITYPPVEEEVIPPIQDPVNPQDPDPLPDATDEEVPIGVVDPLPTEPIEVSPDPSDPVEVVDEEEEVVPPDTTADVGQDQNKNVTQDEPNTTEDPNSPAIDTTPEPEPASATVAPTVVRAVAQSQPTVTEVAGEQDVKTNPQSDVGGIDAVNSLFDGEDIGKQEPEEVVKDRSNLFLVICLGGVILLSLLLTIILLKRSKDDDKKS